MRIANRLLTPSDSVSSHPTNYEYNRRLRETNNEHIINVSRIIFNFSYFWLGFLIAGWLWPDAYMLAVHKSLIPFQVIAIGFSLIVYLYLRLRPAYAWWRKYVITVFDTLFYASYLVMLRPHIPETMYIVAPLPILIVVIALNGVRYSTRLILFHGFLTMGVYSGMLLFAEPSIWVVIQMVFGSAELLLMSFTMAFIVSSLTRLHQDSVAKERLSFYMPPDVINEIIASPELTLGAVEREVTVMFADISGFTAMSSTMTPQEIVDMLNEYFAVMVEIVLRHGGTLEKYIGDALLAVWGAPLPQKDHADRALRAAIEMQQAVNQLNQSWLAAGKRIISIHVGLHTGKVAAGNIGTAQYIQYATIGDTTNVTARICGVAAAGQVVISEATQQQLTLPDLNLISLPPTQVKGKSEPLKLYVAYDPQAGVLKTQSSVMLASEKLSSTLS